ncbi:uroporphyrinogen-III synthase [Mangrovibrevibacter kandeliae]|uniref:uroporphyrinogen-III synthase n=1 Tax=Mangrovibrevibacter kandeliae TaxID=2968473 RepID=UPI00211972E8|nr:uroporphyrinogen-III synthase [Aurantimonas sp. CSK15Z-1]
MARVLILREVGAAKATARLLTARGHDPLILPTEAIQPTGKPPPAGDFSGFLVTSANAVEALAAAFPQDPRPVLAVGERTAGALRAAGFPFVLVGEGDGAALARRATEVSATAERPLLYAAGRVRTDRLETALKTGHKAVVAWEVYETRRLDPSREDVDGALAGGAPAAVLLLSAGQSWSYAALLALAPHAFEPAPRLLCLSERVAAALPGNLRADAAISPRPSLASLFDSHL